MKSKFAVVMGCRATEIADDLPAFKKPSGRKHG